MATTLADRIRERMEAMGTNPTALARQIGRDKDFVRQLLSGRKRTISSDAVAELARVFGCETSDLLGTTGAGALLGAGEVMLDGTIEAETWRRRQDDPLLGNTMPMAIFADRQIEGLRFFVFHGPANEGGICDGALITVVSDGRALRGGQLVVVERRRDELVERSVRRVVANATMHLAPLEGAKSSEPIVAGDNGATVVGTVISAAHFF